MAITNKRQRKNGAPRRVFAVFYPSGKCRMFNGLSHVKSHFSNYAKKTYGRTAGKDNLDAQRLANIEVVAMELVEIDRISAQALMDCEDPLVKELRTKFEESTTFGAVVKRQTREI